MIGSRLGPYEITAKLGEGGMGEVYRATDTKLKRDVAIKVLPAAFTEDKERLARFEREAQLLAQLHHPNIASIFGLEESDGTKALVMELVEGPTLAERLASGPLPLDESLSIARQIAEALEEAHEKGIIHRDLKPQNIKASIDGKVKVLDFGLAKAMDPAGTASGGGSVSQLAKSPTLTIGATVQGMILGTAAYMSPEQAKGLPADKRADIWAFGVVLYEMLLGGTLFGGDTVGDTLAAVIRADIGLEKLPASTPPPVRRLLRRCLERNPKNRLHDIADARLVLDDVLAGKLDDVAAPAAAPAPKRRPAWPVTTVALVAGLLAGWLLHRIGGTTTGTAAGAGLRAEFQILAPEKTNLVSGLALSPDGRLLAFVARGEDGRTALWIRRLDSIEAEALPGTTDARYPFWAPDGRRIGFFAQNRLKITDLFGGQPMVLAETGSTRDARGATWNATDEIVFAPTFTGPLFVVSARGGEARPATRIEEGNAIGTHRFPCFLPDGKRFLFYAATGTGIEPGTLHLGKLGSLDVKPLGPVTSSAVWAEPGHVLYVRGDSLVAHRFDLRRDELVGEPVALGVSLPGSVSVSGQRSLAAATNGLLVYRVDKRSASRIVVTDRQGTELRTIGEGEENWYYGPRLSPDGRRLAISHYEAGSTSGGVWVHDLDRNVANRLTFGAADDTLSIWSPDGRALVYSSMRGAGPSGIYRLEADRPGEPKLVYPASPFASPEAWSAAGERLLFVELSPSGRNSLGVLSLSGERQPLRLGQGRASEWASDLSPDGRWLAYTSDASRRWEVYVRPLEGSGAEVRVSTDGGFAARWRSDGRELFYVDETGRLMAVPVTQLEPPTFGTPQALFSARLEEAGDRQYDVFPGGERFILNRSLVDDRVPIEAVLGWTTRLEKSAGR